ncbi:hypothetical protein [Longimicrobium terrae]|uniref:Uncharacterized protein n=1 Tax=Longimicrobium terrae TaxID=1639882 RepID=A0A841H1S9_9BACT|nr:hypothetical protein [Longimicrobium terrae]MBB4637441.1 hypothetical protein [Longimicrobium terrae]MBB6071839.1 hypothetical protein [Longimicrobium terrae]NNC30388.1 hypothetical protein [Longimicrobium terrae]
MITTPRFIATTLLVLLGACTQTTSLPSGPAPAAGVPPLIQAYAQAMANSAMYSPQNVLPLHPVVADSAGNVRVVTLGTWNPSTGPQTMQRQTWVTVVPEVRDSCDDWTGEDVKMRLRQLLGLHPADSVAYFVEITAPAAAMFRPTVDPAVTTQWPCAGGPSASCGLQFPAGVDTAHVVWMANQMLSSWQVPNGYPQSGQGQPGLGYPWTRLGYTYNWHPGSPRYGASEYLVRQGAQVNITAVNTIAAYCATS